MVPKAYEEVTIGNPFKKEMTTPEGIAARRAVIKQLNIQVDTMGSQADRRALYEQLITGGVDKRKQTEGAARAVEESDAIILSQIGASAKARGIQNPSIFTTDNRLVNNDTARTRSGVSIVRRLSAPGGPLRGKPGEMAPGEQVPFGTPGYNPDKANAMLLGLLALGALLNWLSDIITEERIRKDIKDTEDWIRKQQQADPHMGILVGVELWQTIPHPDSAYTPAPNYQGIDLIYAETRGAAEIALRTQWSGMPAGMQRVLRTMWIPPLMPPLPRTATPDDTQAPWLKRYRLVENALQPPPDYTEALHILNGSSMYDILRVVYRLATEDNAAWSLLWQQLLTGSGVPFFLRVRLGPAFSAVSDVRSGTGDFAFYKNRLDAEFSRLSSDDQKTIEDFFSLGMQGTQLALQGRWLVVIGQWTWYYTFDPKGVVGFSDLNNPSVSWEGRWKWTGGFLEITWDSSRELWTLPLNPAGETGTSYQPGGKVTSLKARKA